MSGEVPLRIGARPTSTGTVDRAAWLACLPAAAKLAVSQTLEDEETLEHATLRIADVLFVGFLVRSGPR